MKPQGVTLISQDQINHLISEMEAMREFIESLSEKINNIERLNKWLTINESAKFLSVTPSQVHKYAKAGHLTKYHIGEGNKLLRFDRDEVMTLPERLNVRLLRKRP